MARRCRGFLGRVIFQQAADDLAFDDRSFGRVFSLALDGSAARQHQRHRTLLAFCGLFADRLRATLGPDIQSGQRDKHDNPSRNVDT